MFRQPHFSELPAVLGQSEVEVARHFLEGLGDLNPAVQEVEAPGSQAGGLAETPPSIAGQKEHPPEPGVDRIRADLAQMHNLVDLLCAYSADHLDEEKNMVGRGPSALGAHPSRRVPFVKYLGALSLATQAVFIPWFVIATGMGDPETARFGAFSFSHPVVQFVFAVSLFVSVVAVKMVRFSRGAKGPTNVGRLVLMVGTLFELGLAGLVSLSILAGPKPRSSPLVPGVSSRRRGRTGRVGLDAGHPRTGCLRLPGSPWRRDPLAPLGFDRGPASGFA